MPITDSQQMLLNQAAPMTSSASGNGLQDALLHPRGPALTNGLASGNVGMIAPVLMGVAIRSFINSGGRKVATNIIPSANQRGGGGGGGMFGGGGNQASTAGQVPEASPLVSQAQSYTMPQATIDELKSRGLSDAEVQNFGAAQQQLGGAGAGGGGAIPPNVSGAAGAAEGAGMGAGEGAALAAGGLGRWGGMLESSGLGKLPFVDPAQASLGGGAALAGAGLVAGSLVDKLNIGGENSRADQGLSNALKGAGIGGGIGMALGGPVGAGAGAIIGGVLDGGLHAIFGNHDSPQTQATKAIDKTNTNIDQLAQQFGVGGTALSDLKLQYQVATSSYMANKDYSGAKDYLKSLSGTLPAALLQAKQQQDATNNYNSQVMSMQHEFAPMFSSLFGNAQASNKQMYENAVTAANTLQTAAPQLAASITSSAANAQSSANALLAAYASQITQAPYASNYNQMLQNQQQLALTRSAMR